VQYRFVTHGKFPVTLTVDDGSGMSCGVSTVKSVAEINGPPVARMMIEGEDLKRANAP
jgi:hypothetical protein